MSVFALELETEVALVVLDEQAVRILDKIQPADLFGCTISSP